MSDVGIQNNFQNGVLICSGTGEYKNIGDYIQSLASEQFFEHIDCLVEREHLDSFKSEIPTKVIMNGWFMFNPQNWPPSKDIEPLFISFHIVPSVAEKMLTNEGIEYLKKYEPIGCRDLNTVKILKEKGIKAYFSGCLTLTLGKKYFQNQKDDSVIFVDPYYETIRNSFGKFSLSLILLNFFYGVFHLKMIKKLWNVLEYEKRCGRFEKYFNKLNQFLNCSSFYKTYSKNFEDEILFNAKYYTHSVKQSDFNSEKEKFEYAKFLLYEYAKAKYVVTSRIHCALPCVGINTPVIFVTSENLESQKNPIRSSNRFGGLINLFHVMKYEKKGLIAKSNIFENKKLNENFEFKNKDDYLVLKTSLEKVCNDFTENRISSWGAKERISFEQTQLKSIEEIYKY